MGFFRTYPPAPVEATQISKSCRISSLALWMNMLYYLKNLVKRWLWVKFLSCLWVAQSAFLDRRNKLFSLNLCHLVLRWCVRRCWVSLFALFVWICLIGLGKEKMVCPFRLFNVSLILSYVGSAIFNKRASREDVRIKLCASSSTPSAKVIFWQWHASFWKWRHWHNMVNAFYIIAELLAYLLI